MVLQRFYVALETAIQGTGLVLDHRNPPPALGIQLFRQFAGSLEVVQYDVTGIYPGNETVHLHKREVHRDYFLSYVLAVVRGHHDDTVYLPVDKKLNPVQHLCRILIGVRDNGRVA